MAIPVRHKAQADQAWVEEVLAREWGGRTILIRDRPYDAASLPALIAGECQGLAVYAIEGDRGELVALNAFTPWQGIGTALIEALVDELRRQGVRELRVSTTNDNLDALRFYQRRGFRFVAVYPGEVDAERDTKPSIPTIGAYGIPLHDALELSLDIA